MESSGSAPPGNRGAVQLGAGFNLNGSTGDGRVRVGKSRRGVRSPSAEGELAGSIPNGQSSREPLSLSGRAL